MSCCAICNVVSKASGPIPEALRSVFGGVAVLGCMAPAKRKSGGSAAAQLPKAKVKKSASAVGSEVSEGHLQKS